MSDDIKYTPQPMRASPRRLSQAELDTFIAELRKVPNVTRAARCINRTVSGLRDHKNNNPEFSKAWDDAIEDSIVALEDEVHRRAFEGVDKPVTFQGVITDTYKECSDTLAMFLLKAHRPEKYRDRTDINITNNTDQAARIAAARERIASGTVIEGEAQEVVDDGLEDLL